jgi:hypothetical protein
MADNERHPFGGGIGDYVVETGEGGVAVFAPGATIEFWSGRDSGTKYADITEDKAGTTPLSAVISQDGSPGSGYAIGDYPIIYGPPGVRWMWASADGGPRKIVFANDLAEDLEGLVSADVIQSVGDLLVGVGLGAVDRLAAGVNGQVLTVDDTQPTKLRWKTPDGGGGGGGGVATTSDTLWVAAADAPSQFADAPYICDGTADQDQINTALNNALGLRVGLSPGTFNLSASITLNGSNNVDAEVSRYLRGSGTYATTLVAAAGVNAIVLANAVCPHVSDLRINLPAGAGNGIHSTRSAGAQAGNRSFFHGSIKNVQVNGPWNGTHTGWGLNLGSGFRYVAENVEVSGTGNGIRVLNESAAFNCGDAVFLRCFVEIIGANGTAYHVSSPTGNANQVAFITCHGIADPGSAGTTMWKFDGAGATSHIRVVNSNAEQFKNTVVIGSTAFDIDVDLVHVTQPTGTFAAVAGYSSKVAVGLLYVPASAVVVGIAETNGYAAKPNRYEVDIYAEAGSSVSASLLTGVVEKGNTDGTGTIAGVLKAKPARGRTFTWTKTGTPAAPTVGKYPIYNDTGNDLVLRSARAYLDTAYTTGSTIVDINLNGVTIFPGGTNRPTIAAAAKTSGRVTTGVAGVIWPAGQAITVDIDAVGTAGAAAELTVQLDTFN